MRGLAGGAKAVGLYRRKGTAVWWCRFRVAGHEIRRSTRQTVRRRAEIEERRLRSYVESKAPRRRAGTIPGLADLAGLDLERAVANGATEQHQAALRWQWRKITHHLGTNTPPSQITAQVVQTYIAKRRGESAKGQTIVREVQALKRACSDAHKRGWMPWPMVDWPMIRRDGPDSRRKGKLHPPSILAAWLEQLPQDARDEAALALLLGMRAHEVKRIAADWITPAPAGIGVDLVLRMPAESTKSRRDRVLPLAPRAAAILLRRLESTAPGEPLISQANHKTAFRLARKRLAYPVAITLRDLRHTWATLAARSGGVEVAKLGLGHANLATTDRYVSVELADLAAAMIGVGAAVPADMCPQDEQKPAKSAEMRHA